MDTQENSTRDSVESTYLFGTWLPMETAPKDGQKIIVWDAVVDFAVWEQSEDVWTDLDGNYCDPSHWMPLPSPPNAENSRRQN